MLEVGKIMTLRYISGASIVTLFTCGFAVAPAFAQNGSLLPPEESAVITVTGCLQMDPRKSASDKFVLATPRLGAVANVANAACDSAVDAQALELEDADNRGINETLVGRWIEISGRLERETSTDPNNLRELSVRSFRVVPVAPPRAEFIPAPIEPRAEAPAAPEPAPVPVATTLIEEPLPRTASPLAMFGLVGLISLAGGLGFRYYRSYVRG
jgi:hypothetical protein